MHDRYFLAFVPDSDPEDWLELLEKDFEDETPRIVYGTLEQMKAKKEHVISIGHLPPEPGRLVIMAISEFKEGQE